MDNLVDNLSNLKINEEYSNYLINGINERFCKINENVFRLSKSTKNWVLFCQSFEFNQIIINLTEINYTVQIRSKLEKFKKIDDNIFRYSDSKEEWLSVCKSNNPTQCCNYVTQDNYCKGHQSLCVIIKKEEEDEHNYFYRYIGARKLFFDNYKGDIFRFANGKWKLVCKFLNCGNLQIKDCFCSRHCNGIDNGRNDSITIGDNSETYIFELITENEEFNKIKIIGRENSELDIVYKIKGENELRGIQIKTLQKIETLYGNNYYLKNIKKYSNDTVIIGISKDRSYACIFQRKEIGIDKDSIYVNINNPSIDIKNNIFDLIKDKDLFMQKLFEYCKISIFYKDSYCSESNSKERDSMKRLEEICIKNNILFNDNLSSDSSVDCIINNFNIQCKYSARVENNYYSFAMYKRKDNLYVPYEDNDNIHYFIFENIENEFYIIPIYILIYFGYIKTDKNNGKIEINLHSSKSNINHWSKYFINTFELLITNEKIEISSILDMSLVINKFNYECYKRNINSERNVENLSTNLCQIEDKIIKCSKSIKIRGYNYVFTLTRNKNKNIVIDNMPDFFAFLIEDKYWYIFDKKILIEQKIIGINNSFLVTDLSLPIHGAKTIRPNKQWTQIYFDNFDLLK